MAELFRMTFAELQETALALPASVCARSKGSREERIRFVYELVCDEIEAGKLSVDDDLEIGHAWDSTVEHF